MVLPSKMLAPVRNKQIATALLAGYSLLICILLPRYIPWSSVNFILGLIGLPLTVTFANVGPVSNRFVGWAMLLVVATVFIAEQAVVFIACVGIMFVIWEAVWGRVPFITLLTVALMSPTAQFLVGVFSFPIRLQLTKLAGYALGFIGQTIATHGNVITCNGIDFSVDPACVGLKMLLTSLLFGIFLIALLQHRHGKYLGVGWVLCTLTAVTLLNVFANLIRIIALVQFGILPENPLHELIGIICLIVYILLPSALIINILVRKVGECPTPEIITSAHPNHVNKLPFILSVVAIPVIVFSATNAKNKQLMVNTIEVPFIVGYTGSWFETDILKYKNEASLVYIKKLKGGLYGEHNPVMCWLGAGYQFGSVEEKCLYGRQLYYAILTRDNKKLYTAWWYDNGNSATISQLEWRWQSLVNGAHYAVINVTAESDLSLQRELEVIIGRKLFYPALK